MAFQYRKGDLSNYCDIVLDIHADSGQLPR